MYNIQEPVENTSVEAQRDGWILDIKHYTDWRNEVQLNMGQVQRCDLHTGNAQKIRPEKSILSLRQTELTQWVDNWNKHLYSDWFAYVQATPCPHTQPDQPKFLA